MSHPRRADAIPNGASEDTQPPGPERPNRLLLGLGALTLLFTALAILASLVGESLRVPKYVTEVLIALAAVSGIHLIEVGFLFGRVEGWLDRSLQRFSASTNRSLQELFDEKNEQALELFRRSNHLVNAASASGLIGMWPSRNNAMKRELMDDLRASRDRMLLLGIAFAETLTIQEVMDVVEAKMSAHTEAATEAGLPSGPAFRLLLMDPLRYSAIVRAFMEHPQNIGRMLEHDRSGRGGAHDPLLKQHFYLGFEQAKAALWTYQDIPTIIEGVRFYGYNPSCWLVIIDDVVYFQPYSFGEGFRHRRGGCIGGALPVWKFEARSETGAILIDHFNKLWATSFVDMYHMEGRVRASHEIIRSAFEDRGDWLNQVGRVLDPGVRDRRVHPRQKCQDRDALVNVIVDDPDPWNIRARIGDHSDKGLGLVIEGHLPGEINPGSVVHVRAENEDHLSGRTEYALEHHLRRVRENGAQSRVRVGEFIVARITDTELGLLTLPEQRPQDAPERASTG